MATVAHTASDAAPTGRTTSPTSRHRCRTSTCSRPTCRSSRPCAARAASGCSQRGAALGREVGGAPLQWGRLANENRPVLRTHDRYGNRIDEVEFHPAWHDLMRLWTSHELHSLPWTSDGRARTSRARACT